MRSPHFKIILLSVIVSGLMFGFSFAFSPLYSKLCNYVDFYAGVRTLATKPADLHRTIKMEFITNNNQNLPWEFYAKTASLNFHPNENVKIFFYAKNNSKKTMTVQAIPSFSPTLAAKYIHKTECFCFNQQTLKPGEFMYMPLIFHFDEDLPSDIIIISLSYTLFDVTNKIPQRTL